MSTSTWPPANPQITSRRPRTTRLRSRSNANDIVRLASPTRRASVSGLTSGPPKAQRTSKTSHKLVFLPSAPQTKPIRADSDEDLTFGYETDTGVREHKSEAERMNKEQRQRAGFKRLTAYCIAEELKMKFLISFLKREHNVSPRVFDEALYVMYHLPLLPGYGPNSNFRSSVPLVSSGSNSIFSRLSEAEENGYQGTYFTSQAARSSSSLNNGYISSSPVDTFRSPRSTDTPFVSRTPPEPFTTPSEVEPETPTPDAGIEGGTHGESPKIPLHAPPQTKSTEEELAEVVFFEYGVVVFFGLAETQERGILEDIEKAGILKRKIKEEDWEVEECHFAHDPYIAYPRIYNDFFTLKSRSHLLKLSISHALAQSTLLAHYETNAQRVLSSPLALSIPKQLAASGGLQLRRHEALKLTGRLFKLRTDVNLVSNVLDVPELFWSEASLKELYDAVREYMEIKGRVQVLNEKLGVASDFLDAIHDHLNNSAMERITWIVIWLIVIAILVELGEVVARLVVHATMGSEKTFIPVLSQADALGTL